MTKIIDSLSENQGTRLSRLKKTFQMALAILLANNPQAIGSLTKQFRESV